MSNYLLVVVLLLIAIQLADKNLQILAQSYQGQGQAQAPNQVGRFLEDTLKRDISNSDSNDISYSQNTKTENIAIGNTNNNNFNFQKSDYTPTQLTQVVLNVPKPKKLRISRPPTEEEYEIKRKILDVYDSARREAQFINNYSLNFDHLGRIIQALNPKYIATERVRRVAFGDPNDPTTIFSIPDIKPQPLSTILLQVPNTNNNNDSLFDQLNALNKQFRSQVSWDLQFANLLANTSDKQFTPEQLAFKRLLMCLTQQDFCPKAEEDNFLVRQEEEQQDGLETAASEMNQQQAFYMPPPPQQQFRPVQQQQPSPPPERDYNNQIYQQPINSFNNTPRGPYFQQQQAQYQQPLANMNNNQATFGYNKFRGKKYSSPNWIQRQQKRILSRV